MTDDAVIKAHLLPCIDGPISDAARDDMISGRASRFARTRALMVQILDNRKYPTSLQATDAVATMNAADAIAAIETVKRGEENNIFDDENRQVFLSIIRLLNLPEPLVRELAKSVARLDYPPDPKVTNRTFLSRQVEVFLIYRALRNKARPRDAARLTWSQCQHLRLNDKQFLAATKHVSKRVREAAKAWEEEEKQRIGFASVE